MSCENCDCADNSEVRRLRRELQETEQKAEAALAGLVKVTRLIDDVSRDLSRKIKDLQTDFTYHEETPHLGVQP
jgi:hypothetical protein